MDELDKYIEKFDGVLEREQQNLSHSNTQHHSDWDNHIFTLSTAAIGFTFAFLPIGDGDLSWLAVTGVICFIVAIGSAATNYIYADKGIEYATKKIQICTHTNQQLRLIKIQLDRELDEANQNKDSDAHNSAQAEAENKRSELFENDDFDNVTKDMGKNRRKIVRLNYIKTYAFMAGLVFVVSFALFNIGGL